MELFKRSSFLSVVESQTERIVKQVEGYNDNGAAPRGLRIRFRVDRKLDPDADTADVSIYNLSPESRSALAQRSVFLSKKDPLFYLQLWAGYEQVGLLENIYQGLIIRTTNERHGPDWVTNIHAETAVGQMSNTQDKSYGSPAGTSASLIVRELFSSLGLGEPKYSARATEILNNKALSSFVSQGSIYETLRNLLGSVGLTWTINPDGPAVVEVGHPVSPNVELVIDETTGLLGTPRLSDMGIDFRMLLDPALRPGQLIRVTSKTLRESLNTVGVGDTFLVMHVYTLGDTHSDEWYHEVSCQFYPPVIEFFQGVGRPPPLKLLEG